jgi:NAD(P)-dependent dehydrogenase (short-subunit alcohol dehydrogenase family)
MTSLSLADKVVLVTGASRGIGYQAALEAARRGAHVITVARTVGGLEDLDDEIQAAGGSSTIVPLDLRESDGIDRLGAAIFSRWGRLDGLVANAGTLKVLSPVPHVEPKDFDEVFATNVTANYRLIRSLDMLLRQAPAGRAVFLTSASLHAAKPFWGPYGAAKAALDALVRSYASEVATSNLKVNLFDPGPVRTALRAKAMPGENPETLPMPVEIVPALIDLIEPAFGQTRVLVDRVAGTTTPV